MTLKELVSAAKLRCRKTAADELDGDIERHVNAAISDLQRIGVTSSFLTEPSDPLIIEAILDYVRANYSIDTTEYPVLIGIYNDMLIKIKGTSKYFEETESESTEG